MCVCVCVYNQNIRFVCNYNNFRKQKDKIFRIYAYSALNFSAGCVPEINRSSRDCTVCLNLKTSVC